MTTWEADGNTSPLKTHACYKRGRFSIQLQRDALISVRNCSEKPQLVQIPYNNPPQTNWKDRNQVKNNYASVITKKINNNLNVPGCWGSSLTFEVANLWSSVRNLIGERGGPKFPSVTSSSSTPHCSKRMRPSRHWLPGGRPSQQTTHPDSHSKKQTLKQLCEGCFRVSYHCSTALVFRWKDGKSMKVFSARLLHTMVSGTLPTGQGLQPSQGPQGTQGSCLVRDVSSFNCSCTSNCWNSVQKMLPSAAQSACHEAYRKSTSMNLYSLFLYTS